jgi:succinate dehydrogenase/fumarate reductase flavoprotein subunit
MRALSAGGNAHTGLYAAGEAIGTTQWTGRGYSGGIGVAGAIIFGMDAGRDAAAFAKTGK